MKEHIKITKMNLPGHLLASKRTYLQKPVLLPNGTWYIKTMYTEKGSTWGQLYEQHCESNIWSNIIL